jgi:hypothetical protein
MCSNIDNHCLKVESVTDANGDVIMTKTAKDGKYHVSSGTIDELVNVLLNETGKINLSALMNIHFF